MHANCQKETYYRIEFNGTSLLMISLSVSQAKGDRLPTVGTTATKKPAAKKAAKPGECCWQNILYP